MRSPNKGNCPRVEVRSCNPELWRGWNSIGSHLRDLVVGIKTEVFAPVLAVECYSGVFEKEIRHGLSSCFSEALWIDSNDALLPEAEIARLVELHLRNDDTFFGNPTDLTLESFVSEENLIALRVTAARAHRPVVVIGPAAALIAPLHAILVYADITHQEVRNRERRNDKQSSLVDWRACDRFKQHTMPRWNYLLDTSVPNDPKLVTGTAFRRQLAECVTRPFRVVQPSVCRLNRAETGGEWRFDRVPDENCILLTFGEVSIEIPLIDLVFAQPRSLLGAPVVSRFGTEFPIRFDLLDTIGGGNLSLQMHPQHQSYYLLDARPGAVVYLGRRSEAEFESMIQALEAARRGGPPFDDSRFIARFPARKHDQFLIPAGTLHCAGGDCMVLAISTSPYLFPFKVWDWGRAEPDGRTRPTAVIRGKESIRWECDEDYVITRLINQIRGASRGEGWREERTGLHESQLVETRRHWFTSSVPHHTGGEHRGSVNVLTLVAGEEAVVESLERAFEPLVVRYAETFIVPAAVGPYRIRPSGRAVGMECATIKASVRG